MTRYEKIPNISVNLQQIRAVDKNLQIPFNATVLCKTKTGPIGEFTKISSYTECVNTFGVGDSSTPVLYGIEQMLRTYGFVNIIRLAASDATEGSINLTTYDGEGTETTEEDLKNIITGKTDYKTDIYNGDEIRLNYDKTRTRMQLKGTINGVNYNTPLEIIDLSTAKADDLEKVLDKLVGIWNEFKNGITLTNNFTGKTQEDKTLTEENTVYGTVELGNSGNTTTIENDQVIEAMQLIEDPKVTRQDAVICPEYRNYEVVNAGIALKNKYFYIVCAKGSTLTEKQDAVSQFTNSDEGVLYIPSECVMADPSIKVPFECAALYGWANSYSVSRYLAPAGTNRATLAPVVDVTDNLSDEDAETFYNDIIPANPVKYLTNYGFTLYGQKTMDPEQEFTSRINVSGLVNYITIEGKALLNPYLFEYAPISTFQKVYIDLDKLLGNLVTKDVIYNDYIITCDESNNTQETLMNHELHVAVAFRPLSVTEYIYLDLTVTDDLGGVE